MAGGVGLGGLELLMIQSVEGAIFLPLVSRQHRGLHRTDSKQYAANVRHNRLKPESEFSNSLLIAMPFRWARRCMTPSMVMWCVRLSSLTILLWNVVSGLYSFPVLKLERRVETNAMP